jgi:hypothetical protein
LTPAFARRRARPWSSGSASSSDTSTADQRGYRKTFISWRKKLFGTLGPVRHGECRAFDSPFEKGQWIDDPLAPARGRPAFSFRPLFEAMASTVS